jgi:hypothetical protein
MYISMYLFKYLWKYVQVSLLNMYICKLDPRRSSIRGSRSVRSLEDAAAMEDGDPTAPLSLSQSSSLELHVSRDSSLATRVDDVSPLLDLRPSYSSWVDGAVYLGRTSRTALDLRSRRFAKGQFRAEDPWRRRQCQGHCRVDSPHDCW